MATMAQVMTGQRKEAMVTAGGERVAKNLLLFFAAPLIGLAYIVVFPFVGCLALAKIALRGA